MVVHAVLVFLRYVSSYDQNTMYVERAMDQAICLAYRVVKK